MPDPMKAVPIEVSGKPYKLYFGNRARRLFQRETGQSIAALESPGDQETTVAIWAALQQHHPALTVEDVDDLLDAEPEELPKAFVRALYVAVGKDPAEAEEALADATGKEAPTPKTTGTATKKQPSAQG